METLYLARQRHKAVEISWEWDAGIDVRVGSDDSRNFTDIHQIQIWLRHFYQLGGTSTQDILTNELQRIYDSEINITMTLQRSGHIELKVRNTDAWGSVSDVQDILPWLQAAIHDHYPKSKYDVERLGGKWTPEHVPFPPVTQPSK